MKRFKIPPIVYLMILGIIMTIGYTIKILQPIENPKPIAPPLETSFPESVAGTGIIEAFGENINLAPYSDGKVENIYVKVGQRVRKGTPILKIDSVEDESELKVLLTEVEQTKVNLDDAKLQLSDMESISDPRAINQQDLKRKRASVNLLKAQYKNVNAKVAQLKTRIKRTTLIAPTEGEILKIYVKKGEYIYATSPGPAILMGRTDKLQVRVDIDEVNASKVRPNMQGELVVKGNTSLKAPIKYLKTEPYITPKKNLTGSNDERVDIRVLQLVYELNPPKFPVYVGQQVNVFLKK